VDRGVVLSAPGAVAVEEIELDGPGPGEVQVRMVAAGVCHTDLPAKRSRPASSS
jgi:aryl-alcohol dehydrogenase